MSKTTKKDNIFADGFSVNAEEVVNILVGFISDCIEKTKSEKAVLGLSGGLDSSLVACLAAKALGPERVLGLIMPYKSSSESSKTDAELVVGTYGISSEVVDITPMVDSYFEKHESADPNRRGNFMARQRMAVLYDTAARERGLVIGTSNKSELLLGYGTIFGDLAYAVNPVGDLYKTQIRILSEILGISENIRTKPPSADLIAGQTDEDDLGFTYDKVDKFLYLWADKRKTEDELEKEYGYDREFIKDVVLRVKKNHFKRISPVIAKVSARTIGHEFRYAWEWSLVE
ncbi:NAD+ synthase [candidate division KSB1 bacterium]